MPGLHPDTLDAALAELDEAHTIHICTDEPAVGALANTTAVTVGNKNLGVGNVFGAPANAAPNGRKVASTAIVGGAPGNITATSGAGDDAAFWAVVDDTRTLAAGALAAGQAVVNGNTFTLTSFEISLPSQPA